MRALLPLLLLATACGSSGTGSLDAGPDTRCGLDCVAQANYGLVVNRCFEYSDEASKKKDPPLLGALVLPVFTLDNNVKVLPVEYRQGGQLKMRDSFTLKNGDLVLVRREFLDSNQSVTYRDASLAISGVTWLHLNSSSGETSTSAVKAFVVDAAGKSTSNDATYRVTTATPSASELNTPLNNYLDGLKLLPGESPTDHGSDARRIFVSGVGFVLIASPFSLAAGAQTTPLMLQRIRDLGTPDAGPGECSLGAP
jgi:hypothetical protein